MLLEPPLTFRFVMANLKDLSARLLSGGISGCSRKYHHCSAFCRRFRKSFPAS
ncbi:hypothetical protein CY0110_19252 [Crocosphaera chwakensis CCY0110]|uniref:Uncharacterized protein n=1 Tax=Crocosphaera chwakensis CCY0110 TaxID=391612 RepID=A3IJI2_9CHRO|nr:hypothetical protein CY0110_19252 [Crocosphaera chwakensis CCY0110]